jgi:hypothetical protein
MPPPQMCSHWLSCAAAAQGTIRQPFLNPLTKSVQNDRRSFGTHSYGHCPPPPITQSYSTLHVISGPEHGLA